MYFCLFLSQVYGYYWELLVVKKKKKKVKKSSLLRLDQLFVCFLSTGELNQKLRWTEETEYIYCSSQQLVCSWLEHCWTLNLCITIFQSNTLLVTPLLVASQIKHFALQVRFSF